MSTETNRFKFIKKLSSGGFGLTYLVDDTLVNEKCIIKFVPTAKFHNNEIDIMKIIHENGCHPNLICLRDYFEYKGYIAIISDYIIGDTLVDLLKTNKEFFQYNEFFWVFKKMIDSLNWMHNILNVAHLDIKPQNIIISIIPDAHNISIIDFGSGCLNKSGKCNLISWTNGYIPPSFFDIIKSKQTFDLEYGKSVDIFSLGITFYYLLFMDNPFTNVPNTKVNILEKLNIVLEQLKIEDNKVLIDRFMTIYPHINLENSKKIIKMFTPFIIEMLNPDDYNRVKINTLVTVINDVLKTKPRLVHIFNIHDNNIKKNLTYLNQKYNQNRHKTRNALTKSKYTADRIKKEIEKVIKEIVLEEYSDVINKI